jgi:hypothetical protein
MTDNMICNFICIVLRDNWGNANKVYEIMQNHQLKCSLEQIKKIFKADEDHQFFKDKQGWDQYKPQHYYGNLRRSALRVLFNNNLKNSTVDIMSWGNGLSVYFFTGSSHFENEITLRLEI